MLEELYLVRHAMPDRSLAMPYNVHPGPPLTEIGRREAAQVAAWLHGRGIERLLSSPFERASATAAAIADTLEIDVTFVEALREGGPGENLEKIRARVAELLMQLEDSPLRRVAFVTHGACVKALLQHTTDGRIDLSKHIYDYGNCSPTAGVWRGTRFDHLWRWELVYWPAKEPQAEDVEKKGWGIGKCVLL